MKKTSEVDSAIERKRHDIKIPVGHLQIGMFITDLDRDWLETPFPLQGFLIETPEDIRQLADHCQHVWIQTDKYYSPKVLKEAFDNPLAGRKPIHYPIKVSVQKEHVAAEPMFKSARAFMTSTLRDIRRDGKIDYKQAKQTVNQCVSSVLRHPDALLWMTKIRNEHEYTMEHCVNVCVLAVIFGRKLGLREQHLKNLGLCGLLHDVGKMKIPEDILNKPAALNEDERKIMRSHTTEGRRLLMSSLGMYEGAIDAAFSHHERINGGGYPRKIHGHEISYFSRVISIVDAFDAMTGDRCYSPGMSTAEALRRIYEGRGKQFDETLALKFIETIGLYPPGSVVELVNGHIGMVMESNTRYRHLPCVLILLDQHKKPLTKKRLVDLSLTEKGELSNEFMIKHIHKDGSYGISIRDYLALDDIDF